MEHNEKRIREIYEDLDRLLREKLDQIDRAASDSDLSGLRALVLRLNTLTDSARREQREIAKRFNALP
jgi:plasmid maintenance system killer protein